MNQKNITWHEGKVQKANRQHLNGHKSALLWFTGLSGSGKSTISVEVEKKLHELGLHTFRLDGDNIRRGLNRDLAFSEEDRTENIRRIGEVSKLFVDAGILTLAAFISPFKEDREFVRSLLSNEEFIEIYVQASIETCAGRDPKGLYEKVRKGELKNFSGIDSPYEIPESPEIVIDTENQSIDESVLRIVNHLKNKRLI
ncbi:adenylyl-sulfate kinase [Rossellomorea sp. SC111]|uniref:adenylyl-sulfate kinase n=1 Tax=Rossellomorea sp. SC111 TaxID=2968985 RepID=UPI00215AFD6D|nr:adenylyl-sulfate kinase [Rossellomorea sp. SC111]MCR8848738.1 adenylyl-sulfate kinase [Rossellomorea sp. SC111]